MDFAESAFRHASEYFDATRESLLAEREILSELRDMKAEYIDAINAYNDAQNAYTEAQNAMLADGGSLGDSNSELDELQRIRDEKNDELNSIVASLEGELGLRGSGDLYSRVDALNRALEEAEEESIQREGDLAVLYDRDQEALLAAELEYQRAREVYNEACSVSLKFMDVSDGLR